MDIVARKGGHSYAVQCKAWPTSKVGRPDVQRLAGVIAIDNYERGLMISLLGLTDGAADVAEQAAIDSWDLQDILRMMPRENETDNSWTPAKGEVFHWSRMECECGY